MFDGMVLGLDALVRSRWRTLWFLAALIVIGHGVLVGSIVPGWVDLTFVAALVVRRFGVVRVTLTTAGLMTLLVALTPPICSGSREKAYTAAMRSDLKNLASQQEIFYAESYMYTTSAEDLAFTHSDGVTVTIVSVGTGWAAWATHAALGNREGCAIWWGDISKSERSIGEVTPDHAGELACTFR